MEIDEIACMSLLLWIKSRQQFVGEVDFEGVLIDGDIKEQLNECLKEEKNYNDENIGESANNGTDVDRGKISTDAAFINDEDLVIQSMLVDRRCWLTY